MPLLRTNKQIVKDGAVTTSVVTSGLLQPYQAKKFLRQTFDATPLMGAIRHETRTERKGEIDKIGVGRRLLRRKVENTDDGYRAKPNFGSIEYSCNPVRLPDEIVKEFPEDADTDEDDDIPKIAVVGKPNVGKSSLINKLLGEDRVIVSDIAGTTRDAVDAKVKWKDREYIFIDTAGLRRKGKIKEELERYSVIRTVTAVERADVVVVVIDATEGVTEQDAKIAGIAHERGKGVVIAVNKWDAVEKDDKTIYKHTNRIREVLAYMPYAELVFISAKSGQRLPRLFETIDAVIENQTLRIQTGVLNEILSEAVAMQQPPSDRGKRLKIFYMTQVGVKPPTFVIFVNDKELMHFSYTRYIENKVRDAFGFRGTSLKFIIRERGEKS